ncbi:MAG: hypothetical protein RMK29_01295 [Myxococcales bacterium]|nr:hypothetical protein [Myxococcales bacterium]
MRPLLALVFGLPAAAWAQGLSQPERLTAGAADQLLGQLAPDGERLYFVSSRGGLSQIFVQQSRTGASEPLFDDQADATWPRLSPDGTKLLYISRHGDAAGDLCVRDLTAGTRRCLEDRQHADLQAVWMPDASVLLLGRQGLHGDLELRRVHLEPSGLRAEPFLQENLSGPAVSPDGRWLVYVPLQRSERSVGVSFAAEAAEELSLVGLGARGPQGPRLRLRMELPGVTGQPAFSLDGRYLYFTQYLNDTNFDGRIDGNDHGVLFRVPFDSRAASPVTSAALAAPEQLTSAGWNCQYPSPSRGRLIATCAAHGSLDIYALPLEGSVPEGWDESKLRDELRSSQDPWERLLLQGRLLRSARGPARAALLLEMIRQHLGLREHASAAFYTRQLGSLGGELSKMAEILLHLIDHRRQERLLDRGQLGERFVARAQERLAALRQRRGGADADVQALAALVESEVLDALGQEGPALAALRAVQPAALRVPLVLHLYGERAREQLRPHHDRQGLLAAYRALATHAALSTADRLAFSRALVRELVRGQGRGEAKAQLEGLRASVDADSDLAFIVETERWLLDLAAGQEERVREGLFELYRAHKDPDRRRALIAATIGHAASLDSDSLMYQFANTWVSGLSRDQAERRYAERLYRQVVMERAYVQWNDARMGDARGNFFGVTLQTDSLEGHIGFIEARLREGQQDVEEQYKRRFADRPEDPVYLFVRAYLMARALPPEPAALDRTAQEALALLRKAASAYSQRVELQHLWGYLAHRRYLVGRDSTAAQEAMAHYLLALDLARDNVRYRAAVLSQLGLLQESIGNFRAALERLEERGKLPFSDPQAHLLHLLALGRCRFHANREAEAAAAAEEALRLIERTPELARYRPLALDRAALYHLAAGAYAQALARYRAVGAHLAGAPGGYRLTHLLGRAAAALGADQGAEALNDLAEAGRLVADPQVTRTLHRSMLGDPQDILSTYQLIIDGLRARAYRGLGQMEQARQALQARRQVLQGRLRRRPLDEDVLELARVEAGLAGLAVARRDLPAAIEHVRAGLRRMDAWMQQTGTPVHELGLALIMAWGDLRLFGSAAGPPEAELERRLTEVYGTLARLRSPRWAEARARLALQLALIRLRAGRIQS